MLPGWFISFVRTSSASLRNAACALTAACSPLAHRDSMQHIIGYLIKSANILRFATDAGCALPAAATPLGFASRPLGTYY